MSGHTRNYSKAQRCCMGGALAVSKRLMERYSESRSSIKPIEEQQSDRTLNAE
jgi:hypothetical protein